jgi:hypothetical protein
MTPVEAGGDQSQRSTVASSGMQRTPSIAARVVQARRDVSRALQPFCQRGSIETGTDSATVQKLESALLHGRLEQLREPHCGRRRRRCSKHRQTQRPSPCRLPGAAPPHPDRSRAGRCLQRERVLRGGTARARAARAATASVVTRAWLGVKGRSLLLYLWRAWSLASTAMVSGRARKKEALVTRRRQQVEFARRPAGVGFARPAKDDSDAQYNQARSLKDQ